MAGVSGSSSSLAQTLIAIKSKVDSCLKELNSGEGAAVEEKDGTGLLSTLEKALGDLSELQCSQKVCRSCAVLFILVGNTPRK